MERSINPASRICSLLSHRLHTQGHTPEDAAAGAIASVNRSNLGRFLSTTARRIRLVTGMLADRDQSIQTGRQRGGEGAVAFRCGDASWSWLLLSWLLRRQL